MRAILAVCLVGLLACWALPGSAVMVEARMENSLQAGLTDEPDPSKPSGANLPVNDPAVETAQNLVRTLQPNSYDRRNYAGPNPVYSSQRRAVFGLRRRRVPYGEDAPDLTSVNPYHTFNNNRNLPMDLFAPRGLSISELTGQKSLADYAQESRAFSLPYGGYSSFRNHVFRRAEADPLFRMKLHDSVEGRVPLQQGAAIVRPPLQSVPPSYAPSAFVPPLAAAAMQNGFVAPSMFHPFDFKIAYGAPHPLDFSPLAETPALAAAGGHGFLPAGSYSLPAHYVHPAVGGSYVSSVGGVPVHTTYGHPAYYPAFAYPFGSPYGPALAAYSADRFYRGNFHHQIAPVGWVESGKFGNPYWQHREGNQAARHHGASPLGSAPTQS